MRLELSGAVRVTSTRRSCPLTSGSQGLVQAVYPVRRHTWLVLPHDYPGSTSLTVLGAAATAAPDRAGLLAASGHGPSSRPPSRAYTAATAWPSPCHASTRKPVTAGVNWHAAQQNYDSSGTT